MRASHDDQQQHRFAKHDVRVAAVRAERKRTRTRTIAVLFSGGDAPGMNAFLRVFVRLGLHQYGARIVGIKDGFAGLVRAIFRIQQGETDLETLRRQLDSRAGRCGLFDRDLDLLQLDHTSVSGLAGRGGIALGASRCPAFYSPQFRRQAHDLLDKLGVNSLVTVGGNGTLSGARCFAEETGMHVVGVPATIDNDIACTELSLGFDTAVNNAMRAIEQINDTAEAHHRIMVVETMGRDSGNLARLAGHAAGAEIVVAPERGPLSTDKMRAIAHRLEESFVRGQTHAIVVVAEGVKVNGDGVGVGAENPAAALRAYFEQFFGASECQFPGVAVRDTVLGHIQRGGSPSAADRLLAAQLADAVWCATISSPPRSGVATVRRGRIEVRPWDHADVADGTSLQEQVYRVQKVVTKWA